MALPLPEPGGRVIGRRCGWSENIGARTRRSQQNREKYAAMGKFAFDRPVASIVPSTKLEGAMRGYFWGCTLGVLVATGAANAKTRFERYEARDATVIGKGGSRITKDGIDFWTMGDPPRGYRIIGVIRDKRGTGPLHGNAVGSSGIAKMAREVGGDALILLNENTEFRGYVQSGSAFASGSQAFGTGVAIPISRKKTTFFVVKYLEPTGGK